MRVEGLEKMARKGICGCRGVVKGLSVYVGMAKLTAGPDGHGIVCVGEGWGGGG